VKNVTGHKPHYLMMRGLVFSHRDFNLILDAYERGEKIYLYTGRGPSSQSLHCGHLIPLLFTKFLQDVFNAPLIIQCTDYEKMLYKNISS